MKEPATMLNINDRAGAVPPQELPPVHRECKVVFRFEILARAKALRKQGQFLQAQKLVDAVLCVCRKGPHHNQ
jgi:hypothetical protein